MHVRAHYVKGKLSADRIQQLEELGFEWHRSYHSHWQENFLMLEAFKKEHGHCRVPQDYKANKKLGAWVNTQRVFYAKNKLSRERIDKLEALGFAWDPFESDWQEMYSALESFWREHGHCRVPRGHEAFLKLRRWIMSQRYFYAKNKIAEERIKKLESLGFEWSSSQKT